MRACFLLLLGASLAIARAQTFHPRHKYVTGDSDTYAVTVKAQTTNGEIDVSSDTTRKVAKVYDNGDADIETSVKGLSITVGGQQFPAPEQAPTTTRVNPLGLAVAGPKSRSLSFVQFGMYFGDQDLSVGQTNTFEHTDDANKGNHYKATVKLVSLDAGKATIGVTADNWTAGQEAPMHLEGTAVVDATTDRLISFTGTAKNLPPMMGGITISSADFSMTRRSSG
ncbi:MAG TPA: hypothetical protein VMI31_07980 [Fimbriimonadaceae bacterium]|nr:hypothetical protein [Fimbriimonadaceae bacterium]